ncbi:hypothetical protein [Streptomyces sp. NPDC002587]
MTLPSARAAAISTRPEGPAVPDAELAAAVAAIPAETAAAEASET